MRRALLLTFAALAGCHQNMVEQPRLDDYGETELFRDGQVLQAPPAGTVARDAPAPDAATRPPINQALLERGRDRYDIYCTPCHGRDGSGRGMIPSRGFPQPPDLRSARLQAAPSRHVFDVISHGYGVMYSYADRVAPADRWAIAAYVRALQAQVAQPQEGAHAP